MIRIQKLKQPKKTSGSKVAPGMSWQVKGIQITNLNKFPVYVDSFRRKLPKAKSGKC